MLKIIFVRHGESKMNKDKVFCGWSDSRLTDKGVSQARKVSDKLKEEKLDIIVTSDLNRCYETAAIINEKHKMKIIQETDLRELNFGDWEGLSYKEIRDNYPVELRKWEEDHIGFKVPRGESMNDMFKRANNAFQDIIAKYKSGTILIVSHSGVIRAILSKEICGGIEGYWKFKVNNCGVTILEYVDDFPVLTGLNQ